MSCSSALFVTLIATVIFIASVEARVFYNRFDGGLSSDPFMEQEQKRGNSDVSFDYDANQVIRNTMKRNRQCLLNAGLSQGCDLSDMLLAQTQARKFMSFAGPGK